MEYVNKLNNHYLFDQNELKIWTELYFNNIESNDKFPKLNEFYYKDRNDIIKQSQWKLFVLVLGNDLELKLKKNKPTLYKLLKKMPPTTYEKALNKKRMIEQI